MDSSSLVEDGVTRPCNDPNWHLIVVARKKNAHRSNTPWRIIPPGKSEHWRRRRILSDKNTDLVVCTCDWCCLNPLQAEFFLGKTFPQGGYRIYPQGFQIVFEWGQVGQSSRHPTVVTLWTMWCAEGDFLTSGSHTGTCNRVVFQWVRLGIFKVEKMNQEGFSQKKTILVFRVSPNF
jgi:hypothetical protein